MKTLRARAVLFTVEEARAEVIRSALACLRLAHCPADGLVAMIWGHQDGSGWNTTDELLARNHRALLQQIGDAGYQWLIADELEGIVSATDLDLGQVRNLEVIAEQLPYDEFRSPTWPDRPRTR